MMLPPPAVMRTQGTRLGRIAQGRDRRLEHRRRVDMIENDVRSRSASPVRPSNSRPKPEMTVFPPDGTIVAASITPKPGRAGHGYTRSLGWLVGNAGTGRRRWCRRPHRAAGARSHPQAGSRARRVGRQHERQGAAGQCRAHSSSRTERLIALIDETTSRRSKYPPASPVRM